MKGEDPKQRKTSEIMSEKCPRRSFGSALLVFVYYIYTVNDFLHVRLE